MIDRKELDELNQRYEDLRSEIRHKFYNKLKFVAKIVIGLFLLGVVVHSACAEPITEFINLNSSQIPYNTTFHLNITLVQNKTLYIERTDSESRLNISYPSYKTFANDTEVIFFNVSITENITENVTLISLFNLSNNINNNSYLYSIIYNYTFIPGPANTTVEEDEEFFVTVIDGNYKVNITTNLLPRKGELRYDLGGVHGETLNISCPEGWITCPNSAVFNKKNRTEFDIKYKVPLSASIGNHTYIINLSSGNVSTTTKIIFEIKEPDIRFMNYVFDDDCFVSLGNEDLLAVKYDCVLESQRSIIDNAIEYLKLKKNDLNDTFCKEVCKPETVTEYVMAGNITETIMEDYDICRTDRDNYKFAQTECFNTRRNLSKEVERLNGVIAKNESECLSEVFGTSVELKNEADEHKKKTSWHFWLWMIGIHLVEVTIVFGFIWYRKFKKEGWSKWS